MIGLVSLFSFFKGFHLTFAPGWYNVKGEMWATMTLTVDINCKIEGSQGHSHI